jgi:hypothetical protein
MSAGTLDQLAALHHLIAQNVLGGAGLDVIAIGVRTYKPCDVLVYGTLEQGTAAAEAMELSYSARYPNETTIHHHWTGELAGGVPFELVVASPLDPEPRDSDTRVVSGSSDVEDPGAGGTFGS